MKKNKILNIILITSALILVGLLGWLLFCNNTTLKIEPVLTKNEEDQIRNNNNNNPSVIIEIDGKNEKGENIYRSEKYSFDLSLNNKYILSEFPQRVLDEYFSFKNIEDADGYDVFGIKICKKDNMINSIIDKDDFFVWISDENNCMKNLAAFNHIINFNRNNYKNKSIIKATLITGLGNVKNDYWYIFNQDLDYYLIIISKDYTNKSEIEGVGIDIDELVSSLNNN